MKHILFHAATAALALVLLACSLAVEEAKIEHLTVASWNIQNLFDGNDNGFEYDEFKNSSGWNNEKYRARLNSITAALKGENGLGADILCLVEVENSNVIEDIAEHSGMGYSRTFFAGAPEGAAGLGILSRLPLIETKTHSFHSPDSEIPRPVAEVRVDTGSGPLVLLACHWKSKLGGEKETEPVRRAGAALVARRIREIEANSPGTPVIVLGDLNENHNEFERIGAAYLCALLPDTDKAAVTLQRQSADSGPAPRDFLVISGQRPPRAASFDDSAAALYSPWFEEETRAGINKTGSFHYKDSWETIDHFLLNAALFDRQGWDYKTFYVQTEAPFAAETGLPKPYNPRSGNGFSDHLPIVLGLGMCP